MKHPRHELPRLANARCFTIVVTALLVGVLVQGAAAAGASGETWRNPRPQPSGKRAVPREWGRSVASTDCNNNGIVDEDEIEACNGQPACDDCNLNGLPDECDIAAGTSSDADLNGIPDECVTYDNGGVDDNWSTDENWDDDISPNNQPETEGYSATVGLFDVVVDENVDLNTLRLREGTTLQVLGMSSEDMEIQNAGGLQLASNQLTQSVLLIGNGRNIDVSQGLVRIKGGGLYRGESSPTVAAASTGQCAGSTTASGSLLAGSLLIETKCGATAPGEMSLSGTMSVDVIGDAIVDARSGCVACALCPAVGSSPAGMVAGGETPPILCLQDMAGLSVGGNLELLGAAAFHHTSTQPLVIGGSFINESTCPDCVVVTGPIVLGSGTGAVTAATSPQSFEVSTLDLGPVPPSSVNVVTEMEVTSGAGITFEDAFANHPSGDAEALYVDTLVLRQNASVTVSGCTLYYRTLIDDGATIATANGGGLAQFAGIPAIPAASSWGLLVLFLSLLTMGSIVLLRRAARIAPPHAVPAGLAYKPMGQ